MNKETSTRPLLIRRRYADSVICPCGAAWSARHPVKVEIVGSNPIEGAGWMETARYANRQSDRDHRQGGARISVTCGFDSHSCHSRQNSKSKIQNRKSEIPFRGWCSSRRPVKPLPSSCEAGGERFDSFTTQCRNGPVVYRLGRHPLKVEKGVRIPSGLLLSLVSGGTPEDCVTRNMRRETRTSDVL